MKKTSALLAEKSAQKKSVLTVRGPADTTVTIHGLMKNAAGVDTSSAKEGKTMARQHEIEDLMGAEELTLGKQRILKALSEFGRHALDCAAASSGRALDSDCDCGWNHWRTVLDRLHF